MPMTIKLPASIETIFFHPFFFTNSQMIAASKNAKAKGRIQFASANKTPHIIVLYFFSLTKHAIAKNANAVYGKSVLIETTSPQNAHMRQKIIINK